MSRNLQNLFGVFAVLLVLTGCICQSDRNSKPFFDTSEDKTVKSADKKTDNDKRDRGDFKVEHLEVKTSAYKDVDQKIKRDKTLEKAALKLNNALILPKDITLRTKDCEETNAFYDPNNSSVTVCYELMEYFYKLFRSSGKTESEANQKMFDAVQFVFLHEIGHALIDVYDLPITGNEEDAADRCSSYINLEELGEQGVNSVIAMADAFRLESRRKSPKKENMADEHLLQEQRFYNSLCMIYGSDVNKYSNLVSDGYLPKDRAERCPDEYKKTVESWERLLKPWRKS